MKRNIRELVSAQEVHEKWMKNPKYSREYSQLKTEFEIASKMIEARLEKKMSQEELAKKVGTGQAVISRLEGMNASPSLSLLKRVASALGTKITITIQ